MKLIKPNFEIITQNSNNDGMLKHIELCGRVCYKSEDKIKDNTAAIFVNGLIKSGHTSVLEHGTVYLKIPYHDGDDDKRVDYNWICEKYYKNKYSSNPITKVNIDKPLAYTYITTNYRVLVENNWLDDLKYQCEPTEFHEKRITVRFVCDRGILAEFTRHRSMSMTAESTRYCNYSKDKFGNELTFIIPCWIEDIKNLTEAEKDWYNSLVDSEFAYIKLLNQGWTPQQARAVLPNALKTELIMTGFISDWRHFLKLRCDKSAHPQAQELANMLLEKTKIFN